MKTKYLLSIVFSLSIILFSSCKEDTPEPMDSADKTVTADFTSDKGDGIAPCTVSFTNTSKNAVSYSWDFGDGNTSILENPTNTYTSAGTYTVKLIATDSQESSTKTASITIEQLAKEYYLTYKIDGVLIEADSLSASRNTISDPRSFSVTGDGGDDNGYLPSFKMLQEESFIGFIKGLQGTYHYSSTSIKHMISYTDANGVKYTTKNDADGVYFYINEVSYTSGGVIDCRFEGFVSNQDGTVRKEIIDGIYRIPFYN